MLDEMRAALEKDRVWSGELISQRKNGQLYDIQLTIAPVHDQNGNKISYVGSQRDITRQKELDRLKDNFVSDVSHELRTPTANISLYLELLEHASKEKTPKYLKVIKEQSQLLSKLVEDILDLSRLKMGKAKKIEFAPVDINSLTEQVIVAHLPLADASGLNLQFTPCPELPPVRGEKNQLARVVTNLVSNAIHYTFVGSVAVSTCHENGGVCLKVSDTGIGIDPDDLGHIFERFYRGNQVRQSEIHGTGLGLAIVKEIVDLHDGVITLSSEVGKGTTFRVYLPIFSS
jgi:two-component system phosphate regulon sensor histidine kinase PhoR